MNVIGLRQDRWGCAHYRGHGPMLSMAVRGINARESGHFIPSSTSHVLTGTANSQDFLHHLVKERQRLGFKLVVDLDEYVGPLEDLPAWANSESEYCSESDKGRLRLAHLEEADGIIFSSSLIRDRCATDKPHTIIPLRVPQCVVDMLREPPKKPLPRARIYLNHSPSRHKDMEFLGPILTERSRRIEVLVSGEQPVWLAGLNGNLHVAPWVSFEDYWGMLQDFSPDIILSPLSANPYNAAKGPTRFIEAALVGAYGIYSPVDPYLSVPWKHLVTADPDQWANQIDAAMDDIPYIRRKAMEAREFVLTEWHANKVAQDYISFMESL